MGFANDFLNFSGMLDLQTVHLVSCLLDTGSQGRDTNWVIYGFLWLDYNLWASHWAKTGQGYENKHYFHTWSFSP